MFEHAQKKMKYDFSFGIPFIARANYIYNELGIGGFENTQLSVLLEHGEHEENDIN